MTDSLFRAIATAALVICLNGTAMAQGEQTRVEIGAGVAGIVLENDETGITVSPGISGRVDVNVMRRLAIETRGAWFPRDESIRFQSQGGQTLHMAAGAKATFVEGGRVSLYGLVLPGVLHFTQAQVTTGDDFGPTTHFALELGGGVDIRATRRLAARLEWTTDIYGYPAAYGPLSPPGPNGGQLQVVFPAAITGTWQFNGTVAYRLGQFRAVEPERRLTDRGEIGAQLTSTTFTDAAGGGMRHAPGGRAFASYRLFEYVYVDGAVGAHPGAAVRTEFDGGRRAQVLAGVKIGLRRDRVGMFFKTRVGVTRHAGVVTAVTTTPRHSISVGPVYAPTLDLGAVLELYAGHRFLIRLDAGDTASLPRTVPFVRDGVPAPLPAPWMDSIDLAVGAGWRF